MERIRLEICLFNLRGFDRVNILELVEHHDAYQIYENYGERKDESLTSSLVGSYDHLEQAASVFDVLVSTMLAVGFRSPRNGQQLEIPGFSSIVSESGIRGFNPSNNNAESHRLLDI
jgi:hypothetical protein